MPKTIDMTMQGEFLAPPENEPPRARMYRLNLRHGWALKLGVGAALLAVVAGGLAAAALILYVLAILIPVALVAGLVAYVALRFQLWRLKR